MAGEQKAANIIVRVLNSTPNGDAPRETAKRILAALDEANWMPEAMGAKEAAAELVVEMSNLGALPGLPEPAQELSRGKLYLASKIRALARKRAKERGK